MSALIRMIPALAACLALSAWPVASATAGGASEQGGGGHGLSAGVTSWEIDGLRVIHKPVSSNPIVSIQLFLDGGSSEAGSPPGALSLAVDVATNGGPEGSTKSAWAATLDRVGASVGGSVGYDYTVFSLECVAPALDGVWPLFRDAVNRPALAESEIELRRRQRIASLRSEADDPDDAARLLARELLFGGHPYETRPEGTIPSVTALTRDDLAAALTSQRQRARAVLVVVGGIPRDEVDRRARELVDGWEAGARAERTPVAFAPADEPFRITERATLPTNYLLGYFVAPPLADPDGAATLIGVELLSDRLFEEVRTKRNLTYAVSASVANRRSNSGAIHVTATDPATTLGVIRDTIEAMLATPPPEAEVKQQIEMYQTRFWMALQSNASQGSMLGHWELVGGGWENADRFVTRMEDLGPKEIAAAVDRWVRDLRWAFVGAPARAQIEGTWVR